MASFAKRTDGEGGQTARGRSAGSRQRDRYEAKWTHIGHSSSFDERARREKDTVRNFSRISGIIVPA